MIKIKRGIAKLTLAAGLAFSTLLAVPGCIGFQPYVKGREARPYQTYVEVSKGQDIHYVKRGNSEKNNPTILLFHGLTRSVYDWKDVLPLLAEKYEVYALDLPGFGDSDLVPRQKTVDDLVESVDVFMEKQGIDNAVFVGHSMGSDFISAFYKTHPEKVGMLISVSGYIDKEHTKQGGPNPCIMHIPFLNLFVEFLAKTTAGKKTIRNILESVSYDDSKISEGMVNDTYRNLQSCLDFKVAKNMAVHLRSSKSEKQTEQVPHYYISGRQDNLLKVIDENYPGLIMLENCGHFVPLEKPEELSDLIDELIKKQIEKEREEKLLRLMESE